LTHRQTNESLAARRRKRRLAGACGVHHARLGQ
jgi:hypothetical protein